MNEAYSDFAAVYDELMDNIPYDDWFTYLHGLLTEYGINDGIIAELGCGTGNITERLARSGYDMIGIDNSASMLDIANEKKTENNSSSLYLCQDMRNIDMFGTIDITLCALDSINHLNSIGDVKAVFDNVAFFSEIGGLFIFDVNTLYKHRNILANNTFTYETDSVYCVWENSLDPKTDEVKMELVFFEKEENGLWSRSSDSFSEKAYSEELIEQLLDECGLELVAKYGDDSFEPPKEDSQRIVYVARSRKTE